MRDICKHSLIVVTICLSLLLAVQRVEAGPSTSDGGPAAEVKAVLNKAMDIQTQPGLQGSAHRKERARLIGQVIAENFLSDKMARRAIAGYWNKISPSQRNEFETLFVTLFQSSYTHMVLDFLHKEKIEYRPVSKKDDSIVVPTVMLRPDGHIPVDYVVAQRNGRWYIDDVIIDGVSIVKNYADAFHRVIATSSFSALLEKMRLQSEAVG
jgi:phospholipid transport system substrate-binding protein